ncbi:MAG: hypothetical protein DME33_12825 [Verrucomicrobia bacterium]|nr:MAG: hypothetical protein DME33_12825 [Verrucomicrobiota bacterium]
MSFLADLRAWQFAGLVMQGLSQPDLELSQYACRKAAAEQNYALAQYNLRAFYASGRGVATDEGEAIKWYLKADAVA